MKNKSKITLIQLEKDLGNQQTKIILDTLSTKQKYAHVRKTRRE